MRLNLDDLFVDTEAIAFQTSSKLGQRLTALMQEVMDYRESLAGTKGKVKKVDTFAKKLIRKGLPKIVKEEVGFNVTQVIFSEIPCGMFAIVPKIYNDNIGTFVRVYEGTDSVTAMNAVIIDMAKQTKGFNGIEKFQLLSDRLNLTTGKIAESKDKVLVNKKYLIADIYFDNFLAFLVNEVISAHHEAPTAAEIAAIMLHEIGHFISMLELVGHQYLRLQATKSLVLSIAKSDNQVLKLNTADTLLAIAKENGLDSVKLKEAELLRAKIEEMKKENTEHSVVAIARYTVVLLVLLTVILFSILNIVGGLLVALTGTPHGSFAYALSKGKTGDILKIWDNKILIERYADQYVARHGYAAELALGLQKLVAAVPRTMTSSKYGNVVTQSKTAHYVFESVWALISLGIGTILTKEMTGYDVESERIQFLRFETMKLLRQADLPQMVIDRTLRQLDSIDNTLKKNKLARAGLFIERFTYFLKQHLSIGAMIHEIINGKLAIEYEQLIRRVDRLVYNPLFEKAARLKKLA